MQNARGLRAPQWCALALVAIASLSASVTYAAPPRISGTPATTSTVGVNYSFRPTASDADGNRLTFSITNKPGWASFNSSTGQLSGVPFAEHARTWSGIVIAVTDGTTRVSLPSFSLVTRPNSNASPTITGTAPAGRVGTAYAFQPTARDPEGRTITFSARNLPSWATFSSSTGRISGTPTAATTHSNVAIIVTDGVSSASMWFNIVVSASSGGGSTTAPTISGTPATTGRVGTAYSFTPTARDPNGDRLTFSISNRPTWAAFDAATGRLSGTPSATGTFSSIQIRVSDGTTTASLPAFSIVVSAASSGGTTGSAALSWTPPTRNTDGSTLTNLAGYRIAYGTSASSLSRTVSLANPGLTSYVVDSLAAGTWYFSIRAYTAGGTESAASTTVSKVVR
jgi:hypothetical protein